MIKVTFRPSDGPEQVFTVDKRSAIIGRGSSCDIVVVYDGISREHCKIEVTREGACFITDLGSTNGILLDTKRLKPNKPTPYAPFHSLSMGSIPWISVETSKSADASLAAYRNVLRKEEKVLEVELDMPVEKKHVRFKQRPVRDDEIDTSPEGGGAWKYLAAVGIIGAVAYQFLLTK